MQLFLLWQNDFLQAVISHVFHVQIFHELYSNILNRIATIFFPCNLKCNYFSLWWTFYQYSYVEVLLKSLVYLCNWIRSRCQFLRRNFCQFWWWKLLRNYSYDKPMENNELLMQLAKLSWERNRGWCFLSGFLRLDLNICCNRIQEWIDHFTDAILTSLFSLVYFSWPVVLYHFFN